MKRLERLCALLVLLLASVVICIGGAFRNSIMHTGHVWLDLFAAFCAAVFAGIVLARLIRSYGPKR